MRPPGARPAGARGAAAAGLALAACALWLLALPAPAQAGKEIAGECGAATAGSIGGEFRLENGAVAVNRTGAGGVAPGTVYVAEGTFNKRVSQLGPSCEFVRAWGIDVIEGGAPNDLGEDAFEICDTTADPPNEPIECKGSEGSGPAHPGALGRNPEGIAVDQATGRVYVADQGHNRVEVFSAAGQPLGAFGWGILDGSEEVQLCTVETGCETVDFPSDAAAPGGEIFLTLSGGGVGISPAGEIYLAGPGNRRVDVFEPGFEGEGLAAISFKRSFGWDVVRSGPGDSEADEEQRLTVSATEGTYFLRVSEPERNNPLFDTEPIAFDAPAADPGTPGAIDSVQEALDAALEGIGGEVTVSGGPGDETGSSPYEIAFGGTLGGDDIRLRAFDGGLGGGDAEATPETIADGGDYEICAGADGDACKPGVNSSEATEPGRFNGSAGNDNPRRVAIDPETGAVFVLDGRNGETPPRVHVFDSEDTPLEVGFGGAAIEATFGADVTLSHIALDPDTGHLLAAGLGEATGNRIRVLELDDAGEALDVHGTELTVDNTRGIAAAPRSAGGSLFLATHSAESETLVGLYVLAEEPPRIEVECGATTATMEGEVFSDGEVVGYHFEHVAQDEWEQTGFEGAVRVPAADALVGPAPGHVAVGPHEATGLTGSEPYRFRLVAAKEGFPRFSETVACTTGPAPPAVSAAGVLTEEAAAVLKARVNPQNEPTSYRFQYTTRADFEASEWANAIAVPEPDGEIAAHDAPRLIAQTIEGLAPGTAYRARLVAANETGTSAGAELAFTTLPVEPAPPGGCPNEPFRDGPSALLPDCRAYELVSPPGVPNLETSFNSFLSDDGSHVAYRSLGGSFAEPQQNTFNPYASHRGAEGWSTTALTPPFPEPITPHGLYNLFSNRLRGFSEDFSRVFLTTENGVDPEDTDEASDLYLRRAGGDFEWISRPPLSTRLAATSSDAAHAVLLGDDGNVYEWVEGAPPLVRAVNVRPGGGLCPEALVGGWGGSRDGTSLNAISADGRRVFFGCEGGLYVRIGGASTTEIAAPGRFVGASRDGSRVLFTSAASFVGAEDTNGAADLYRYDLASGAYTRITPDSLAGDPAPRVRTGTGSGVVASADGSRAYFVARGVLTEAPNANGQSAAEGIDNVYLYDRGRIRFVASPQSGGVSDSALHVSAAAGSVFAQESPIEWDVSTGGAYLAFATKDALLAADADTRPDVYAYDLAARRLSLATTGPVGGNGDFGAGMSVAGTTADARRHRSLGAGPEGAFVFFETDERLVSRDRNATTDVYERDLGSGRTWLISSGSSSNRARLIGAGADGETVAFMDPRPLTLRDPDGEVSVYVARIGGGFPPPAEAGCLGEGCKGAPSPAPAPPRRDSEGVRGSGNAAPAPAAKRRCARLARAARRLSARAGRGRLATRRLAAAGQRRRAVAMRRRARRLALGARRRGLAAKRCRRAARAAAVRRAR